MVDASKLKPISDKSDIKSRVRRRYFKLMPNRKRYRIAIWVAFFVVAATISAQLLYPADRALPFAKLGGKAVGWQTELSLAESISKEFTKAKFVFTHQGRVIGRESLTSAGAEPHTDSMVQKLSHYEFYQRLIPGSILWQRTNIDEWSLRFKGDKLKDFATSRADSFSYDAVNASLAIEDGQLVAVDDKPGARVSPEQIIESVTAAKLAYGSEVNVGVAMAVVPPRKTSADFSQVRAQAEAALARPLDLSVDGMKFAPSSEEKARWLSLAEDDDGAAILAVLPDRVRSYIDQNIAKKVGRESGVTNIALENGREVGREVGNSGLAVNSGPLTELIRNYLLDGQGQLPLVAEMVEVQPRIIYNSKYTTTQEGLQAYISEKAKHGAWIRVQQLDGERWSAGADDNDSVVSASTYKLYVSLYLFKEMQEGKRDWGTPILGTDTSTCFDRMTIASTNPCAEEWLTQFGRTNLNNFLYDKGFSRATTFTNPTAAHTSAADLTRFMIGLEQGTLVGGAYRDRLLSSLIRHPYRSGVPAGSAGQVWNKVGFLWNYVNDAAIVHHPRGKYVVVIMTKGQSYAAIANMTREIEKIMYP